MTKNLPSATHNEVGFAIGNASTALVTNPIELVECYQEYEEQAIASDEPISLYGFVAFAQRRFGITNRWWARHSRGDKDASKILGLRHAVEAIEARVAGRLATGGLKATVHAGMAAQMLKTLEERDQKAAERELQQAEVVLEVSQEQIANIVHPSMTPEQYDACVDAGVTVPLYSQHQLEAGMPLFMPELPNE